MSTDAAPRPIDDIEFNEYGLPIVDGEVREPPKKRRGRQPGSGKGPGRPRKATALAAKISAGVNLIAAGVTTVDEFDGAIIAANADKLGKAWAPVIEANPKFAQMFAQLEKGGVWGAAIIATMGVVLPILVRHVPDLPPPIKTIGAMMAPPEVIEHFNARARANAQTGHAGAYANGAAPSV